MKLAAVILLSAALAFTSPGPIPEISQGIQEAQLPENPGSDITYTYASTMSESLNLTLTDEDEQNKDGVNSTWEIQNMLPGDTLKATLNLTSTGEVQGDNLSLRFNSTNKDPGCLSGQNEEPDTLCGAEGMEERIELIMLEYNLKEYNLTPGIEFNDTNSNGFIDLKDMEKPSNSKKLDGLEPPINNTKSLKIGFRFAKSAGNNFQGDKVVMTIKAIMRGA